MFQIESGHLIVANLYLNLEKSQMCLCAAADLDQNILNRTPGGSRSIVVVRCGHFVIKTNYP